jgi:hypothetical protein
MVRFYPILLLHIERVIKKLREGELLKIRQKYAKNTNNSTMSDIDFITNAFQAKLLIEDTTTDQVRSAISMSVWY